VIGGAIGATCGWLWWRSQNVALRAERDASQGTSLREISEASAKAAAEWAAAQLREHEGRREQQAAAELEQRRLVLESAVGDLVRPVAEQLAEYRQQVEGLQRSSAHLHGELKGQLEQLARSNAGLQQETQNLVTALRRPEVRGGWGEQQLRRIVELAGMIEHCDFDEQVHAVDDAGGRHRADLVVHLPNGREVIVDAKVPLDAFLDGLGAKDNAARDDAMKRHARQLRNHVETLAKRAYPREYGGSVDFVVAFVPGDPLLAAAFEYDPSIFERAASEHVIIATPTTLIALLRTVAYGWQQEAVARNAQEIAEAGRELYARVRTLMNHAVDLGSRLRSTVEAYNKFVGSLERRLLPHARRFETLGAVGVADPHVPELATLTELPEPPVVIELAAAGDDHASA
jgi:DNA recombination protein RmuC